MTTKTRKNAGPQDLADMLSGPAKRSPAKKATPAKPAAKTEPATVPVEPKAPRHEDDPRVQAVKEHFKPDATNDEIYEVVKKALSREGAIHKYAIHLDPALATERIDTDPRVVAVREHAKANFETGGWDIVSETWSNEKIYDVVKKSRTPEGAIRKVATEVGIVEEVRADVIAAGDAAVPAPRDDVDY